MKWWPGRRPGPRRSPDPEPAPEVPEGPSGVWMLYADGTRYDNLPTVYVGTVDGIRQFEAIPPRDPEVERPVAVGAASWPGKTGMSLPMLRYDR